MEGLTLRIVFSYVFVCTCHRITSLSATLFELLQCKSVLQYKKKKAFNENIQRATIKQNVVKH